MKSLTVPLICVGSVVLGAAIGIGMTLREFAHEHGVEAVPGGGAAAVNMDAVQSPGVPGQARVIVLGGADYDFGVMERNEKRGHTFQLKNVGQAPATITMGHTTCKCTSFKSAKDRIEPGEVVDVTLEWEPKSFADSFRQSGDVEISGDPQKPILKLEIHGRVIQTVRPIPENIVLNNVSVDKPRTSEIHVYCFRDADFQLKFDRCENAETAKYFDVEIEPLAPAIIDAQPEAHGGARVTVTVKPGLPLGPLEQVLHFTSNLKELPELSIPVKGSISGDLSIVGSKSLYDSENRLIRINGVPRSEGGVYRLQLLVKGPHAEEARPSVAEVEPADVLQVDIDTDNPTRIKDGRVLLYPLTITIAPGSRPVSRLGSEGAGPKFGKIVMAAKYPDATDDKQLLLYVKFAVEGE